MITNLDKTYPDKHIGDNVNWDKTARDYLDKGGFRHVEHELGRGRPEHPAGAAEGERAGSTAGAVRPRP